jgi:hypothetical protein
MPLFVKSTVTFVGDPGADGFGEIPCKEMLAGDDGDNGLADDDGLADGANGLDDADGVADGANGLDDVDGLDDEDALGDDDGVADDDDIGDDDIGDEDDGLADEDALGDDDGMADDGVAVDVVGLCTGVGCPFTSTENDLVARPWPPCHTSKPASTSIRYHDGLIQPRLTASSIRGRRSKLLIEVVPGVIV